MKHFVVILVFLSIIAGISMTQEAVCNCIRAPCNCGPQPPHCNCPFISADLDVTKLPVGPGPCFCPIQPEPVNPNPCRCRYPVGVPPSRIITGPAPCFCPIERPLCKCAVPDGDPSTFIQGPAPCFCPQLPPPLECGQPGIACSCLELPAGVDVNTLEKGPPPCCCAIPPNTTS